LRWVAMRNALLSSAWFVFLFLTPCGRSTAEESSSVPAGNEMSAAAWESLDESLSRAIAWLVANQRPDGSFPGPERGQPGITSICVMALLSAGYLPGQGRYGDELAQAVEYLVSCQRHDGLFSRVQKLDNFIRSGNATYTAAYNHAITGLALSEIFGMQAAPDNERLRAAIEDGLILSYAQQDRSKRRETSRDGWRYFIRHGGVDADLSATSWYLMYLRSAKNSGFDVPSERIERAMRFVKSNYQDRMGTFLYSVTDPSNISRAMAGAGILAMAHGGLYDDPRVQSAGQWLQRRPYSKYTISGSAEGHFHYGVFYVTAAMYQLGGEYWKTHFPVLVQTLIRAQTPQGHWMAGRDEMSFGYAYTTGLVILACNVPNQLLPILQR